MKKWNVAAYLRLSSDDGDKSESNSITNQKNIIKKFISDNKDLNLVKFYIDDGYSGTTFDRPDFKEMLNDIIKEKVNAVIVKDLSRLGRNYIEVGNYIDGFFPKYGIRFIALNDNVDSVNDPKSVNNVIVPFKNLMNDEYARDVSNKVRNVLDNKKENGKFIGSVAPFGYIKDPNNKHNFIVDKKAAKIVKKIFEMILNGKSKKEVIDELNRLEIPTPSIYKIEEKMYNYEIKDKMKKWNTKKLDKILKNSSYTGELVQGKRKRISYKVHKDVEVNPDEWIIIKNHHKAIISQADFDKVQELLYERTIRVKKNKEYDLFAGHLRCSECGNNLTLRKSKGKEYYYCTSYIYKKNCTSHSCNKSVIETTVINIINQYKKLISEMSDTINEILNKKEVSYDSEIIKSKIENSIEKKEKYLVLKKEIKNDLKEKFITEDEYWEYSAEYSKKINELKLEIEKYENELNEIDKGLSENKNWMNEIKNIDYIESLNKLLIEELIEDIVIDNNRNIKVIFRTEDKYFEALDFINAHKYDII